MDSLLLIAGLAGLWFGTELTVRGAVSVARGLGLSEFVVGVAVLSVGSDLPELTVALDAAFRALAGTPTSELVIGSAIGSSLGQIGLVLGIAGLIGTITLPRRVVLVHGGALLGSLVVLALTGLDARISRLDGALLLGAYAAYIALLLRDGASWEDAEDPAALDVASAWLHVVLGLAIVAVGAEATVRATLAVAEAFAVDQALVAIVVIGVGTSLPELSISVGAMLRGRAGLSVGNLIGSNIFDTLVPVGAAAAIAGLEFGDELLRVDLPVLALISLGVIVALATSRGVRRPEAVLVLLAYFGYLAWRILGR